MDLNAEIPKAVQQAIASELESYLRLKKAELMQDAVTATEMRNLGLVAINGWTKQ
jgi:hypothetical protein